MNARTTPDFRPPAPACYPIDRRRGSYEHTTFTFLGYEFRRRRVRSRAGRYFDGFNPAIGPKEAQRVRSEIHDWRLCSRWGNQTLNALARFINDRVRGWINHYGHIYVSALHPILRNLNEHLARWARRKYKRLKNSRECAYNFLKRISKQEPNLFAHWKLGIKP